MFDSLTVCICYKLDRRVISYSKMPPSSSVFNNANPKVKRFDSLCTVWALKEFCLPTGKEIMFKHFENPTKLTAYV